VEPLFAVLRRLRARGTAIVFITHKLAEVMALADRMTVMRRGCVVGACTRAEASAASLAALMVGTQATDAAPRHSPPALAAPRLELAALELRDGSGAAILERFDLEVRGGEIVGLAGLVGSGRSELLRAVFGLDAVRAGHVVVDGVRLPGHDVRAAMAAGLGLVPEDRKRQGLVLGASGRFNVSLASLGTLVRGPLLDRGRERRVAQKAWQRLDVRAPSIETEVSALSGGNQQKVVLARWLARDVGVLLVDEPTRGVDVGAKAAIHRRLDELATGGGAVLMVSSDLPELLELSSRVAVMRSGRLVGECARGRADEETVMRLMAGVPAL